MKTKRQNEADVCPCESRRAYAVCCAPLHAGEPALSAETLMRSRYSAYALRLAHYLLDTWHADTRPQQLELAASTKWLGLKLLDHQQIYADCAEVEFIARFREGGGSAVRLQERSRFLRQNGRWYYVDGDHQPEQA